MGNIYISDGSGEYFSESLSNVLKGSSYIDLERINSLEGVFIANKFGVTYSHQSMEKGSFNEVDDLTQRMEQIQHNQQQDLSSLSSK